MVEQGVYIAPSQFECLFASMAHSEQDINTIITAHKKALENIK
jgi:glutamate-1-semialdehyde 2,1-aminomutase